MNVDPALLRRLPGMDRLRPAEFAKAHAGIERSARVLSPGEAVEANKFQVLVLLEGVLEVHAPLVDRFVEGPAIISLHRLFSSIPDITFFQTPVAPTARTRCVVSTVAVGPSHDPDAEVLHLLEARLATLSDELHRKTEPLEDFLEPADGAIPAAAYQARDVDLVMLLLEPGRASAEAARTGLPAVDKEIALFAHYSNFGAGGRTTIYDELSRFVPLKRVLPFEVYAHSLVPDAASAMIIGVELFGFPKRMGVARLGRRLAFSSPGQTADLQLDPGLLATWDDEEPIQELDMFVAEVATALGLGSRPDPTLLGSLRDRLVDLLPASPLLAGAGRLFGGLKVHMPDGRHADFDISVPKDWTRLKGLQLHEIGDQGERRLSVHGGWRVRLDMTLRQEVPAPPIVPRKPPDLPTVATQDAPEVLLVREQLPPPARLADLRRGEALTLNQGEVGLLLSGAVAKLRVAAGFPRFIGARSAPGDLVGYQDAGGLVRVEATRASQLLVVPVETIDGLDPVRRFRLLQNAVSNSQSDLAKIAVSAGDRLTTHCAVFALQTPGPWTLSRGSSPPEARPLLAFVVPLDVTPGTPMFVGRGLGPEDEPKVRLGDAAHMSVWLPYGEGSVEGYEVAAWWGLTPGAVLRARQAGLPARLARTGTDELHVFVDGQSFVLPTAESRGVVQDLMSLSPQEMPMKFTLRTRYRRSTAEGVVEDEVTVTRRQVVLAGALGGLMNAPGFEPVDVPSCGGVTGTGSLLGLAGEGIFPQSIGLPSGLT